MSRPVGVYSEKPFFNTILKKMIGYTIFLFGRLALFDYGVIQKLNNMMRVHV